MLRKYLGNFREEEKVIVMRVKDMCGVRKLGSIRKCTKWWNDEVKHLTYNCSLQERNISE